MKKDYSIANLVANLNCIRDNYRDNLSNEEIEKLILTANLIEMNFKMNDRISEYIGK